MSAKGKSVEPADVDGGANSTLESQLELQQLQLNDFSEKVELYKERCAQLEKENERLADIQLEINCDRNDIVEFLNLRVGEHQSKIEELEKDIAKVEREKESSLRQCVQNSEKTQAQMRKEIEQMNVEISKYKANIDQISDFRSRKEEMEQQIALLRETLDQKVTEYKGTINEMHRKAVMEKNKAKIEMARRIDEAVRNFKTATEKQMNETTRRAIRENLMVTDQIKKLSDKVMELLKDNDALKAKNARLQQDVALLKDSEIAFAKKSQAANKTIQVLVNKLQESKQLNEKLQRKLEMTSNDPVAEAASQQTPGLGKKLKPRPRKIEAFQ